MTPKISFTISGASPSDGSSSSQQLGPGHQRAGNRQHLLHRPGNLRFALAQAREVLELRLDVGRNLGSACLLEIRAEHQVADGHDLAGTHFERYALERLDGTVAHLESLGIQNSDLLKVQKISRERNTALSSATSIGRPYEALQIINCCPATVSHRGLLRPWKSHALPMPQRAKELHDFVC